MSVAYINYHRKPRAQFLSISQYNEKYGASVPEDKEFESAFRSALTSARKTTDPNEYLQHSFTNLDAPYEAEEEHMSTEETEETAEEVHLQEEEAPELEDFLDDYEEATVEKQAVAPPVQTEAKEEAKAEAAEPQAEYDETTSLSDEIDSFLAETAKDSTQYARDRSHVIHFNTQSTNLASRLMKGRDRYMKRLQQYLDGDKSVKVRMMDNKEILVASLKPNPESLQDVLETAHGEPRYCTCDC